MSTADRWTEQRIVAVRHWTDTLLSFETTRDPGFVFKPGHYARLGLRSGDGESVVWRPMSLVSAPDAERLEFFAVLVADGEFSGLLAAAGEGAPLLLDRSAFGFMTLDQLAPGRDLWLIASGTGLGPFISILRDPAARGAFERIFLVHGVRRAADLAYRDEIEALAAEAPPGCARLRYLPVVTREPFGALPSERIPVLLEDGRLEAGAGAILDVGHSRVMVCGNPGLTADTRRLLGARGFQPGRRGTRGQVAFEHYWTA